MKKRIGKIAAIVLALALMLSLAACGTGGTASESKAVSAGSAATTTTGEKVTLKFLHKWPQPEYQVYFDDIVAAYMKENPNVTIVSEGVADEPIKDKLRVMMGSDDRPDIFFSWSGEFAKKFIAAGAAMDLTEAMQADGGKWESSIMKAGLEPFSKDGKIYGAPLRINGKFFVYNQEIFDSLSLKAPTTWEEFLTVCETLKTNNITPIAFGDQFPWAACHYITGLNQKLVAQDVRMKDYEKTTGEYTDAGYVKALDYFKDMNDKGYFNEFPNSISHDMANQSFALGECAMIYVELEEFASVDTNLEGTPWSFFAMPAIADGAGSQNYLTGAPDGFMISSTTKYPEEAIKFLQYLTSLDSAKKLVETLKWPSPVIGAVNADNSPEYLVKGMKAVESAEGMALWLDTDIDIRISDVYLPGLQDLLNGDISSADLMKKVQEIAKTVQAEP
jgi:raffinose/stachyose/melibiose transport system substrate-binding protein